MFGAMIRGVTAVAKVVGRNSVVATRAVAKTPLVRSVVKQTAIGAGIYALGNAVTGGGGSSLPALPGGGMPGLPSAPGMGNRSIFRDDPNVIEALKPYAISAANLATYYRAPRGFVIVRDSNGDPYALPKKIAQWAHLWKASPKPPISVGEMQALKRADRTAKKVKKILSLVTRVDSNVGSGGRVVIRKKKGGHK